MNSGSVPFRLKSALLAIAWGPVLAQGQTLLAWHGPAERLAACMSAHLAAALPVREALQDPARVEAAAVACGARREFWRQRDWAVQLLPQMLFIEQGGELLIYAQAMRQLESRFPMKNPPKP